jgi:3-dehydroquinate dehydratase I
VNKLDDLLARPSPAIAVSFGDTESDDDVREGIESGLDVAEIRIDLFSSLDHGHVLAQVRRFVDVASLATIRLAAEGGRWQGAEPDRLRLFLAVLPEVDGIDVELSSDRTTLTTLVAEAKRQDKTTIVSSHNFDETPPSAQLDDVVKEAKRLGADYVKVVTMPHSAEDVRRLAEFTLANADAGLIAFGMGSHGVGSRVFFPALGSRLTYASGAQSPVSGQIPFRDMFYMMRKFHPDFNARKMIELELLENV